MKKRDKSLLSSSSIRHIMSLSRVFILNFFFMSLSCRPRDPPALRLVIVTRNMTITRPFHLFYFFLLSLAINKCVVFYVNAKKKKINLGFVTCRREGRAGKGRDTHQNLWPDNREIQFWDNVLSQLDTTRYRLSCCVVLCWAVLC